MKKMIFLILCSIITVVQAEDFPKIKGYKQTSEVRIYTPDNLWEYINGAADQFLDYEFQLLKSCDLSKDELSVSVDIYEMATDLNAFGIYVNERPTNRERLNYGLESTISPPYQALFLKGNLYVKIDVLEGEINEENGKNLLNALDEALPGSEEYPAALNLLPKTNLVPGTYKFANRAFLGLKELTKCIYADYVDSDENEYQYFVMNTVTPEEVKSVWKLLAQNWQMKEESGKQILIKNIPYQGIAAVIQEKSKIYGITGFAEESNSIKKLLELN